MTTTTEKSPSHRTAQVPGVSATVSDLRLLQLLSPVIPTGAFHFSQGMEWAVAAGWVDDQHAFRDWLHELMHGMLARQELPLLIRLFDSVANLDQFNYWAQYALAVRDTNETREEERYRARALYKLLFSLDVEGVVALRDSLEQTQLAGIALAANRWDIRLSNLLSSFTFSWLEQQIANGVKIVPLGQQAGQRILFELSEAIPSIVETAMNTGENQIGFSCPAASMASVHHEQQYTRLYRS